MPLDDTVPAGGPIDHDRERRQRIRDAAVKVLDTPDDLSPTPFEKIDTEEGVRLALNGEGQVLAVMEDVVPEITRFALRRAVQPILGRSIEWTYVELAGGLRVYMSAGGVVISRADINPGSPPPPREEPSDASDPG